MKDITTSVSLPADFASLLFFAVVILVPAVVASRAYRSVAALRWHEHEEDRRGSVIAWAALLAAASAFAWSGIRAAISRIYRGTWDPIDLLSPPLLMLVVPWALGAGLGQLVNKIPRVRSFFQNALGAIDGRVIRPHDRLAATKRPLRVFFHGPAEQTFRGVVVSIDTSETDQMIVDQVEEWADGGWVLVEGVTGAMVWNQGASFMWFSQHDENDRVIQPFEDGLDPAPPGNASPSGKADEPPPSTAVTEPGTGGGAAEPSPGSPEVAPAPQSVPATAAEADPVGEAQPPPDETPKS